MSNRRDAQLDKEMQELVDHLPTQEYEEKQFLKFKLKDRWKPSFFGYDLQWLRDYDKELKPMITYDGDEKRQAFIKQQAQENHDNWFNTSVHGLKTQIKQLKVNNK